MVNSRHNGVEIAYLPNPRVEAEKNELAALKDVFLALGLQPTTLSEGLLAEVREIAVRYAHRLDQRKMICTSVWRAGVARVPGGVVTSIPLPRG